MGFGEVLTPPAPGADGGLVLDRLRGAQGGRLVGASSCGVHGDTSLVFDPNRRASSALNARPSSLYSRSAPDVNCELANRHGNVWPASRSPNYLSNRSCRMAADGR